MIHRSGERAESALLSYRIGSKFHQGRDRRAYCCVNKQVVLRTESVIIEWINLLLAHKCEWSVLLSSPFLMCITMILHGYHIARKCKEQRP